MNFRCDIRQWKTAKEFEQHLFSYDPSIASWAKGIVIHHTYKPEEKHWQGLKTMNGLKAYYESLGWSAGPHLFIACHSPNPEDNGIFQLTALNEPGIHATVANSWTWGIEVVGYFDYKHWSEEQEQLVTSVATTLMAWRKLSVYDSIYNRRGAIIGHREVPSNKTCPGVQIDMNTFRNSVNNSLLERAVNHE